MKSEKRLWNRQKYFKKQQKCFRSQKKFVTRIEKRSLELAIFFTTFLLLSSHVFTKCDSQIGNEYNFVYILICCSICGHKTKSELTDSVPLQLQDSICGKDIIQNYKIIQNQAGYWYEVVVMFVRLYHNINVSKRMLKRRLSYYGF